MRRELGILGVAVALIALAGLPGADTPRRALEEAAATTEVSFTAAGDYGTGSELESVLTTVRELEPDLHLALGDLSTSEPAAERAWCDTVTARVGPGFPFQLLAGDHEASRSGGTINDVATCLPNQLPGLVGTYGRQWFVDVPATDPVVRFVMISPNLPFEDGTDDFAVGTPGFTWTADAIDGARSASIPWVVVGMHHPCLTLGSDTCAAGPDIVNLLVTKQVDLVLTGHERLYERSKQLALAPRCAAIVPGTADPDCIADDDSTLVKGAGTVFATLGTGGIPQRPVDRADAEEPYFAAASGLDTQTWGVLDVRASPTVLAANFVRAAGGTFADSFSIRPAGPDQNAPPVAVFASECDLLTCTVDGSAATDRDGRIASHSWTFGDGATSSGVTASHTYAGPGTFPITLTVADTGDRSGSAVRVVEVTPVATGLLATDEFTREVAAGFGAAELGGDWTTSETTSVSAGAGRFTLGAAGAVAAARLQAVVGTSLATRATTSWDRRPDGSGGWFVLRGRITDAGEYRLKIAYKSDGEVTARAVRTDADGQETAITAELPIAGVAYTAATRITALFEVSGTAPSGLRAKIWRAEQPEPAQWLFDTSDATAQLQGPGFVGAAALLSGATTNTPVTLGLEEFSVVGPGGIPIP